MAFKKFLSAGGILLVLICASNVANLLAMALCSGCENKNNCQACFKEYLPRFGKRDDITFERFRPDKTKMNIFNILKMYEKLNNNDILK